MSAYNIERNLNLALNFDPLQTENHRTIRIFSYPLVKTQ